MGGDCKIPLFVFIMAESITTDIMIILNRKEANDLRVAEWCFLGGSSWDEVSADDHSPIARWQRWCGRSVWLNAEQGWSDRVHRGDWIGSNLRSPMGTRQALACPLPEFRFLIRT